MIPRRKYGPRGVIGPAYRFKWDEVRCTDGTLPMSMRWRRRYAKQARALNKLRKHVAQYAGVTFRDVSINVSSWYRSPAYNANIGGASMSQHVEGRATDIIVRVKGVQVPPEIVAHLAERVPAFRDGGIGWYDADHGYFTHVDHRNYRARWVNG